MRQKQVELTPEEKQEQRFEKWIKAEGVEFKDAEAAAKYRERATRFKDAIQLKKSPDRVPVYPFISFYPAHYAGYTPHDIMYDYDKLVDAYNKYVFDFDPDAYVGAFQPSSGRLLDILDCKMFAWPGHGVAPQHPYQYMEAEYMKAEDYDELIEDPSNFFLRMYLPRTFGALKGLSMLAPLTNAFELVFLAPYMIPFGLPEVESSLQKLMEGGREALRWAQAMAASDKSLMGFGCTNPLGGATITPFDVLGDTLRGTRAMVMDMYRRPEKVIEACDRLTPIMVKMAVAGANQSGAPGVFIPMHKGPDGFMSDTQFKAFYWPSLRKLIMGLVDEGLVPCLFAEGCYNSRLEVIRDLPKGKTIWLFESTDMAKAKEALGDVACIMGNVPLALLQMGTPEDTEAYCRNLIEVAGKDGGFILSNGAVLEEGNAECLRAMIGSVKKYGVYR